MNDKDQSGASKQKRQLKKLIDRAMPNEINSKHENDSNTKFREGYSLIDHRHGLIRDKKTSFALESKSFQVASRAVEAEANRRTSKLKFQPTLQSNLATKENSALSPSSEKAKKHPFVYENMNAFAIKVMEKKLALKYVENLNEEKMNQNIEFNKILEKKLKERRIMIRDKKNNQSKVFKAMLTDAAMKHFQKNSDDNEGNSKRDSIIISKTARGRSSVSSKSPAKNNIYLDNSQIKKISDHVKVEIGLDKLKKQLLDDYDYLAHNHRNEYGSQIENASSLSKEYSRMIINEISPISKQAVAIKTKDQNAPLPNPEESEFSKKASEINQFLMEKTVLSMNNVGRHPANESLNLDLKLAKKCPIHSSHEVRKLFELGVKHADDTDLLTSITAFKQVVILDAELFEAIYNLGCLYEYIKDFELAFKWFYLAKNLQPENKEVNFALALCYFKLMRYEESIEILEKYCTGGAEVSESLSQGPASSSLEVSNQAVQLYMLAICYKGGGKLDKAEVTYNKFLEHIEDSSNREVALFLFALLNKKKSGFSVRKFEEIKMGLLRSFKCIFPEEVDSVSRYWDHGRSAWTETRAEDLIDILLTLGFFKRFPRYILKDSLKSFRFELLTKSSVFFYTEKTEESVYVLTKGSITVKDHTLNIEVPRTAIQLQSGDVINPGIIDGNLVKGFHLWFRCNTDVEAISMDRKVFDALWYAQTSFGLDTTCTVLKKIPIFTNVSQMTVFKIVYDLMKVQTFTQPTIIYDDLSYYDEYEDFRAKYQLKKLKANKDHAGGEYIRKSNTLNFLLDKNTELRALIKSKSKPVQPGLYFILEGSCSLFTDNGRRIVDLPVGSTFGENLLARVAKTFSNYGIIATTERCTQLGFLPKSLFYKIPNYDIYQMHLSCLTRHDIEELKLDP